MAEYSMAMFLDPKLHELQKTLRGIKSRANLHHSTLRLDKLTPVEAHTISERTAELTTDALKGQDGHELDIVAYLDGDPIIELVGTLCAHAEAYFDPSQAIADAVKSVMPGTPSNEPPHKMTREDFSILKNGWQTIQAARSSSNVLENIYATALEIALTEHFQQKQIAPKGRTR